MPKTMTLICLEDCHVPMGPAFKKGDLVTGEWAEKLKASELFKPVEKDAAASAAAKPVKTSTPKEG